MVKSVSIIFVLIALFFNGCKKEETWIADSDYTEEHFMNLSMLDITSNVLCTGDSIIHTWGNYLQTYLGDGYFVENRSECASMTSYGYKYTGLRNIIEQINSADTSRFDTLIIASGTNDAQKVELKEFKMALKATYEYVIRQGFKRIIIVIPPHYNVYTLLSSGYSADEISIYQDYNEFRKTIYDMAKEYDFEIINPCLWNGLSYKLTSAEYFMDPLHPTVKGANIIAKRVASLMKTAVDTD